MDRTGTRSDFTGEPQPPACLIAALAYLARGWSPIPLCPPDHSGRLPAYHAERCTCIGKTPVITWGDFFHDRMNAKQIRFQWRKNPGFNVGVIMGSISGIVAFDVDGESGEAELVRLIGPVPPTWEFSTGGAGRRLLFGLTPGQPSPPTRYGLNGAKLDFLAYKSQTVVPPSLHRNGLAYRWVHGWDADDTPLAPFTEAMRQAVSRTPGQQTTTRPPRASATGPGQQLRRARAYARECDPAVAGQGGRKQTFKVCDKMVHGFGLADDQAVAVLMEEWNGRCQPPWEEEELRKEVEGARERGNCEPIPERPMQDKSTRDSHQHNNGRAGSATPPPGGPDKGPAKGGEGSKAVPPGKPPIGRLGSALKARKTEWFFEPYVPRGMITVLVGGWASGKSTFLAYLMAKARRPILLHGREENAEEALPPRWAVNNVKPESVLVINSEEYRTNGGRELLISAIGQHGADFVGIDPIDSFFPELLSQDNSAHVRPFLEGLNEIAERTRVPIVAIRHPGKMAGNTMVNSRAWGEVPRSIVQLLVDPGPPLKRVLDLLKPSLCQTPPPRRYLLVGDQDQAPRFVLGEEIDQADAAELAEPRRPGEAKKRAIAKAMLPLLLANGPMASKDVYAFGKREAIGEDTMYRAAVDLGVWFDRKGCGLEHVCLWCPPEGGFPPLA